jgi:hypothetical protein
VKVCGQFLVPSRPVPGNKSQLPTRQEAYSITAGVNTVEKNLLLLAGIEPRILSRPIHSEVSIPTVLARIPTGSWVPTRTGCESTHIGNSCAVLLLWDKLISTAYTKSFTISELNIRDYYVKAGNEEYLCTIAQSV